LAVSVVGEGRGRRRTEKWDGRLQGDIKQEVLGRLPSRRDSNPLGASVENVQDVMGDM